MTVTFYDKAKSRRLHVTGVSRMTKAPVIDGRPGGYHGMTYVCTDADGQPVTFPGDRFIVEMVEDSKK